MRCFFCGSDQSSVIDKRAVKSSGEIRRRRECLKGHRRFTTYERASFGEFYVIKRAGNREILDINKLKSGLLRALEKRPGVVDVDQIATKIEKKVRLKGVGEIPSRIIGQAVLIELKKIYL